MAKGRNTQLAAGITGGLRKGAEAFFKAEERRLKNQILREKLAQLVEKRDKASGDTFDDALAFETGRAGSVAGRQQKDAGDEVTRLLNQPFPVGEINEQVLKAPLSKIIPREKTAIPQTSFLGREGKLEEERRKTREFERPTTLKGIKRQLFPTLSRAEKLQTAFGIKPQKPLSQKDKIIAKIERGESVTDDEKVIAGILSPESLREARSAQAGLRKEQTEEARRKREAIGTFGAPTRLEAEAVQAKTEKVKAETKLIPKEFDLESLKVGSQVGLRQAQAASLRAKTEGRIKANAIEAIELSNLQKMGFKSFSDAASTFSKIQKTVQDREEFDFLRQKTNREAGQNWIEFLSEEAQKGRKNKREDLGLMLDYLEFERKKTRDSAEINADKARAAFKSEELTFLRDKFRTSNQNTRVNQIKDFSESFVFKSGKTISAPQAANMVKAFYETGEFPANIVSTKVMKSRESAKPKPIDPKELIKTVENFMDFYEKPGNEAISVKEAQEVARNALSGKSDIPDSWQQKDQNRIKQVSVRNSSLVKLNAGLEFLDTLAAGIEKDFESGAKSFVGPFTAGKAVMSRPFNGNTVEEEAFTAKVNGLFNYYTKEISGSQVTGNEIVRMGKQLPSVFNSVNNFKAKIQVLRSLIKIQIQKNNENIRKILTPGAANNSDKSRSNEELLREAEGL